MSETWIRIATYHSVLEDPTINADYLRYTTQHVIRLLASCAGYKNGYWADDPEDGRMAAITFWDGRHAIEAAGPTLDRFHRERDALGIRLESEINFKLLPVNTGVTAWLEHAHAVVTSLRREWEGA